MTTAVESSVVVTGFSNDLLVLVSLASQLVLRERAHDLNLADPSRATVLLLPALRVLVLVVRCVRSRRLARSHHRLGAQSERAFTVGFVNGLRACPQSLAIHHIRPSELALHVVVTCTPDHLAQRTESTILICRDLHGAAQCPVESVELPSGVACCALDAAQRACTPRTVLGARSREIALVAQLLVARRALEECA